MKASSNNIINDIESKLLKSSDLKSTANVIENTKADLVNILNNDFITEKDKPRLEKLKKIYKEKEEKFLETIVNIDIQGEKMNSTENVIKIITDITNKRLISDENGTTYDQPKKFIDTVWALLGNTPENINTFRKNTQDKINMLNVTVDVEKSDWSKEQRNIQRIESTLKEIENKIHELKNGLEELETVKKRKERIQNEKLSNIQSLKKAGISESSSEYKNAQNSFNTAQTNLENAQKNFDNIEREIQQKEKQLSQVKKLQTQAKKQITQAKEDIDWLKLVKNKFLVNNNENTSIKNLLVISAILEKKLENNHYSDSNVDTYEFLEKLKDTYEDIINPAATGLLHTRHILEQIDSKLNQPAEQLKTDNHKDQITNLYENIEDKGFNINQRLEQIYDKHYIAQLEYALYDFFENYPEEKDKWNQLSHDEKRFFFDELITKHTDPIRQGKHISEIDDQHNLTKDNFYKSFKQQIVTDYEWDISNYIELKKFIEEKIGTFRSAAPNPSYALHVMKEQIKQKYTDHENDIGIEFNKYIRGLDEGSVTPTTPVIPSISDDKELIASIADTESITIQQAKELANKQIEEKYANSRARGLTRARLFFTRKQIENKMIKKELKKTSRQLETGWEQANAVNRWQLTKAINMAGADKITQIDPNSPNSPFNDTIFQDQVNNLITQYVSQIPPMPDDQFKRNIEQLFNKNADLRAFLKAEKISQIGSNLLEVVQQEKKERSYYGQFIDIINRHGTNINTPEFDTEIRNHVQNFINEQKKLPAMIKELGLSIDDINFAEKLATHRSALEKMRTRTVKMRLNMLINTYPMEKEQGFWNKTFAGQAQDQRGLTTAQEVQIDKLGGRWTLYRWMEKHPLRTILGTSTAIAGAGMASVALALPAGVAAGTGALIIGTLNFIKKKGHYTKEHAKFEQHLLDMTPSQRENYMNKLEQDAERRPMWLRSIFPKKFDKFSKSMEYISRVQNLESLISNIHTYTSKTSTLSPAELTSLESYLATAIATLDLKDEEGRNFTYADQGKQQIETLYNDLYKTIKEWLLRYNPHEDPEQTLENLRTSNEICNNKEIIVENSDYQENKNAMIRMRTKLALTAGLKSSGIYLTSARAFGQISNLRNNTSNPNNVNTTQLQITEQIDATNAQIDINNAQIDAAQAQDAYEQTNQIAQQKMQAADQAVANATNTTLTLDPAFGPNGDKLLQQVFNWDKAKFNEFINKIKNIPAGDKNVTIRGTLKDIYGGSYELANQKTHIFFENFSDHILENAKHELVQLTTQQPLTGSEADMIANKMLHRYKNANILSQKELQTITNPSKIKELFKGLQNGTYDLTKLPPNWNLQTANDALHCKYPGGYGDKLTEYFFDQTSQSTPTPNPAPGTKPIIMPTPHKPRNIRKFARVWVPTVYNEINSRK